MGHAPLQLLEGFPRQGADLVHQPSLAVGRQAPEAGLPLPVPEHLVAGFAEAAVEAEVVSDGVLPAVWSRLEEGEVLPAERKPPVCADLGLGVGVRRVVVLTW